MMETGKTYKHIGLKATICFKKKSLMLWKMFIKNGGSMPRGIYVLDKLLKLSVKS